MQAASKVVAASGLKEKKAGLECVQRKLYWKWNDFFGVKCQNKDILIWRFSKSGIPM